jgi:hypothetical protein
MNPDLLITIIFCSQVVVLTAVALALVARNVRRTSEEENADAATPPLRTPTTEEAPRRHYERTAQCTAADRTARNAAAPREPTADHSA